ncbi:MAG: SDR family oxidoreductase [Arcanobacterium sp.]|nr:SDR family oxidoreductase [Arcanobacterium sp.]
MQVEKRNKTILVTGASTGIGQATVRALQQDGYSVLATARRESRLSALSSETGCDYVAADLTTTAGIVAVREKAAELGGIQGIVLAVGGALGLDPIATGSLAEWQTMYDRNVLAPLRLIQEFLPEFTEHGGDIVFISSTAGHGTYPGGGGYVAAKHAERQIAATLRLELVGKPVRVIDIAPGMVKTEEFSLNRFRGDKTAVEAVYAGVDEPLTPEDVAETVRWAISLPAHVNIDTLVVRPVAQASNTLVARKN